MKVEGKPRLALAVALGVLPVLCFCLDQAQSKAAQRNRTLDQRVGEVLAEQAAGQLGPQGRIVALTLHARGSPSLKTQLDAFKATLRKLGDYELRESGFDPEEQPHYDLGRGLSGVDYLGTVRTNGAADLFVSFVGAPELSEAEMAELGKKPRLIAVCRSADHLASLFENHLIVVALVPRIQSRSKDEERPRTPGDWFGRCYQIVTPVLAASLPR